MTTRTFRRLALLAALAAGGCAPSTVSRPTAAPETEGSSAAAGSPVATESEAVATAQETVTDRPASNELAAPRRLTAGGQVIDTQVGHAAPFVADFDQDGLRDLLVGQFGEGKLKIHRNLGSNEQPDYDAPTFFQAGGDVARVPAG